LTHKLETARFQPLNLRNEKSVSKICFLHIINLYPRYVQATYTALKEVETRSMDLLPTWRLPEAFLRVVSPRQKSAQDAVAAGLFTDGCQISYMWTIIWLSSIEPCFDCRVVTPGCQIGYMDHHSGCHQLNRVLTAWTTILAVIN
jgi:hypothetical protein